MFKFSKVACSIIAAGFIFSTGIMAGCGGDNSNVQDKQEFLNVSYDPTRELYSAYNDKFKSHWEKDLGRGEIILTQSHGGSGKQARAVIEGLEADVVTLALAYDVLEVQKAGLIDAGWESEQMRLYFQ